MRVRAAAAAVLLFSLQATPCARANAPAAASAVLQQEHRWVQAAAHGDAGALSLILAPNFSHTNYLGNVRHRDGELRAIRQPRAYSQSTGEQTVDFAGDVAIVHGVNTIRQSGRVVLRLRYTDVYALQHGTWRALSAQETAISAR